jgi:large subunit ribosomal protein L10
VNRTEKQQEIDSLKAALQNARNAYFLDYRGLTVAQVSDLRRKVRATKSKYKVVKNRLAIIATRETPLAGQEKLFDGMTAVVWNETDPVALAKAIHEYSKTVPVQIKGGVVEGKPVTTSEFQSITSLPGRQELIATFAGMLRSPLIKFVLLLKAPLRDFALVARQAAEKKGTEAGSTGPDAETKATE